MPIASDNGCLWLPTDLSDLLTVSVDWQADDDICAGMGVINAAASQWLSGALDDYTYFELLDHYGIDPLGFVGEVEDYLESLLRAAY